MKLQRNSIGLYVDRLLLLYTLRPRKSVVDIFSCNLSKHCPIVGLNNFCSMLRIIVRCHACACQRNMHFSQIEIGFSRITLVNLNGSG